MLPRWKSSSGLEPTGDEAAHAAPTSSVSAPTATRTPIRRPFERRTSRPTTPWAASAVSSRVASIRLTECLAVTAATGDPRDAAAGTAGSPAWSCHAPPRRWTPARHDRVRAALAAGALPRRRPVRRAVPPGAARGDRNAAHPPARQPPDRRDLHDRRAGRAAARRADPRRRCRTVRLARASDVRRHGRSDRVRAC